MGTPGCICGYSDVPLSVLRGHFGDNLGFLWKYFGSHFGVPSDHFEGTLLVHYQLNVTCLAVDVSQSCRLILSLFLQYS